MKKNVDPLSVQVQYSKVEEETGLKENLPRISDYNKKHNLIIHLMAQSKENLIENI